MPLNLFLTFDVESNRPREIHHVRARAGGARGVLDHGQAGAPRRPGRVLRQRLRAHPLSRRLDAGHPAADRRRGHEVGLHCHAAPDLDFYRRNLTSYDLAGQTRILRYGVEFIRSAIGEPPAAFRSGALRINHDTVAAMQECGLPIDSSLKYTWNKHNYNDIGPYRSANRSIDYGGIREFPITVLDRESASIGRDGRRRALRSCHRARLDPNSIPDALALIAALEQMISAGCKDAVFIAHSFSFILFTETSLLALPGTSVFMKNRKPPNYVLDQDAYMKSVFADLLCLLQGKAAGYGRRSSERWRWRLTGLPLTRDFCLPGSPSTVCGPGRPAKTTLSTERAAERSAARPIEHGRSAWYCTLELGKLARKPCKSFGR